MFSSFVAIFVAQCRSERGGAHQAPRETRCHLGNETVDDSIVSDKMSKYTRATGTEGPHMSDAPSSDRPKIEIVRRDLQQLRSKARASGLIGSKNGDASAPASSKMVPVFPDMDIEEPGDKGKQAASKLLAMFRRGEEDTSPTVRGTDFTEKGVARVLNVLTAPREREGASQKTLQRLHKFLTGPVADGAETVAGVSVQKVRRIARMLQQIEKHGWEHVRAHMAKRKVAGGDAKPRGAAEPKLVEAARAAKPRPKRRARS